MSFQHVRRAVAAYAAALLALAADGQDPGRAAPRQSNVLIIIADDLGIDKVGVFDQGDDATRPPTPNIDKLAESGVRFINAYVNAACSPTRSTILTGRYGFRTGIGSIVEPRNRLGLSDSEITLPELLDRAGSGYAHSLCGKWHLTPVATGGPQGPLRHGFAWAAGSASNLGSGCRYCDYFLWVKSDNGSVYFSNTYATTDTTNDAIARANSISQPWLLWVAYNAPHEPVHVPPPHLHTRPNPDQNNVTRYAAMAEALDTEIGRLFATIRPDVLADTTVIFLGDNGTPAFATVPPFVRSRAKGTLFKGGINVPLIISGAAVPKHSRGEVSPALVNGVDIFATVAALASVDPRAILPPDHPIDGINLAPLLQDPGSATVRRYAYSEIFKPNGPPPYDIYRQTIRDQRWKLVRHYHFGENPPYTDQFFDLRAAPPGNDGEDACPCPENLTGKPLRAYERLVAEMAAIQTP